MPANPPEPPPAYCLPHACDAVEHERRWQAHVDAGRIGHRPEPDPAILANRARTAAIFGLPDPGEGDSGPDVSSLSSLS